VGTGGIVGSGGKPGTGGVVGTGGIVGTGGKPGTGGIVGTGGKPGTGGVVGTGGAVATGGVVGTGGTIGTGGVVGTGGHGTGGSGTGGAVGTGGTTACTPTSNTCGTNICGVAVDNCSNQVSCGTCASGLECSNGTKCISPTLIDDFADCNTEIYPVGGRLGYWHAWTTAAVTEYSLGTQPTWLSLPQCAAWMGGNESPADKAGVGFYLNTQGFYNACAYTGIEITYASVERVTVAFRHARSSKPDWITYTAIDSSSATNISITRRLPFPESTCTQLQEIFFSPYAGTTQFAFAIYKVSLY
jgi:hypothetical protein